MNGKNTDLKSGDHCKFLYLYDLYTKLIVIK